MVHKKTLQDAMDVAALKGGECISDEYKTSKLKLQWKCADGHTWDASYSHVKRGSWCPKCHHINREKKRYSFNSTRYTLDQVRKMAASRGLTLLSKKYINNGTPIEVVCANKHKRYVRLTDLRSAKYDCLECVRPNFKKRFAFGYDFVKENISDRGGKLLSSEYINAKTLLEIECLNCNNIFKNTFDKIKGSGQWCPKCNRYKTQGRLAKVLEEVFPNCKVEYNSRRFEWLRNPKTNCKLEIDIFIYNDDMSFTLGVEYDGEQHFRPVKFGGISDDRAKDNFERAKKLDRLKNRLIKKHSDEVSYFIRVKYSDKLDKESIVERLIKEGIIKESNDGEGI